MASCSYGNNNSLPEHLAVTLIGRLWQPIYQLSIVYVSLILILLYVPSTVNRVTFQCWNPVEIMILLNTYHLIFKTTIQGRNSVRRVFSVIFQMALVVFNSVLTFSYNNSASIKKAETGSLVQLVNLDHGKIRILEGI